MTWGVTISDPLNNSVLVTLENGVRTDNDAVALRSFDAPVVIPPGISKVLNLYARQDLIEVAPRSIIQFTLDSTPVFWGPVITSPPITAKGAGPFDQDRDALERISVVGGEQLLKDSIVGPRLLDSAAMVALGSNDVADIALELCTLYAHPALTVDYLNFPSTSSTLSIFYRPESTLYDALVELAKTVPGGASFWVDALGAIHFEAIS